MNVDARGVDGGPWGWREEVINPGPEARLLKNIGATLAAVWPESWRRLRLISTLLLLLLILGYECEEGV